MEKIIQNLKSEIKQLRKEYNVLSKESQEARDFYEQHTLSGKHCEDLIKNNRKTIEDNNKLKLKIRWGQNGNIISTEFLCAIYYNNLIDENMYNKLYPENGYGFSRHNMNSLSMLGEHLANDELAQKVYILNHESKQAAIERHEHEEYMEEGIYEKKNKSHQ